MKKTELEYAEHYFVMSKIFCRFALMNLHNLVILANNSKKLKGFCKKVCNYNDIHLDIFQEFLIYLLKDNEEKLIKKYNEDKFFNYCGFIIYRLNIDRIRDSKRTNTKNTSVLISNNANTLEALINVSESNYNHKIDEDFDRVMNYVKSDESFELEDFIILTESLSPKGLINLSKESGVPYITLKTKRKRIKDKIRENVSI